MQTCPVYKCPGEEVCFSMEDRCDGRNLLLIYYYYYLFFIIYLFYCYYLLFFQVVISVVMAMTNMGVHVS